MSDEDQNHITERSHNSTIVEKEGAITTAPSFLSDLAILWKIALLGLVLLLIPILWPAGLHEYPRTHRALEILVDLLGKIGDAFLIAAILVIAIDDEARLKLIDAVVRAASPKLIGRHLPEPVQNTVLRYFKIDFFRPNILVEYDLIPLPDRVKIVTRITGTLRNCSPNAELFNFAAQVDPSVLDAAMGEPGIRRAKVESEHGTVLLDKEFPCESTDVPSTKQLAESMSLRPGLEYSTILESIEFRPITYFLPLYIGTTVVTATVRVRYPKQEFALNLQLSTIDGDDPKPEETYGGTEWVLRDPILPGQCLLLTWTPKRNSHDADAVVTGVAVIITEPVTNITPGAHP